MNRLRFMLSPVAKESSSIPNGRLLIESIGLSQERLTVRMKSKVAVPTQLLKELISIVASTLPFDLDFYLCDIPGYSQKHTRLVTFPIQELHFIEEGYIEGRFGSKPNIDEEFYKNTYPDIRTAIAAGVVEICA